MKFWTRIAARRQRKTHERYLVERARQQVLQGQDGAFAVLFHKDDLVIQRC